MQGDVVDIPELKCRFDAEEERSTDPLQITATTYLDMDEPFVLFNHSCAPNAAIIGVDTLVAIREIRRGEEISFDYSLTQWEDDRNWPGYADWVLRCACGAKTCRKKITDFRFLSKKFQRAVVAEGRVQDYILKKFKKGKAG